MGQNSFSINEERWSFCNEFMYEKRDMVEKDRG